jgi:hypothetical protein
MIGRVSPRTPEADGTTAIQYRDNRLIRTARLAALAILAAMAGCAGSRQPQRPLAPPSLLTQSRTFLGTPLSGPLVEDTPMAGDRATLALAAPDVTVSFFAMDKMPADIYPPLGPQVRLIVATLADSPVVPLARLTGAVRLIDGEPGEKILADVAAGQFGPSALIWTGHGLLLPGATVAFAVAEPAATDSVSGQSARRRMEVDLYQEASAITPQAAILMHDFVDTAPPREIEEAFTKSQAALAPGRRGVTARPPPVEVPPPEFQSEIALFDRQPAPDAFALAAPMKFENSTSQAILAVVQISPGSSDDAHQKRVAEALAEIQIASDAAARQAKRIGSDPADWPGLSSAVESLAFAGRQRAGLVFLSQQTGAQITQDVVLAADEAIASHVAGAAAAAITAAPTARDRAAIGWILERTTLRMLMQMQSDGKLPPELAAILAARAGQAGRSNGTLEEVLGNATGLQDLQNRLAAENYIFLEDSSPAARVRAYDWLTTRRLAPPGYDPLGPSKDRRAALEQASSAGQNTAEH